MKCPPVVSCKLQRVVEEARKRCNCTKWTVTTDPISLDDPSKPWCNPKRYECYKDVIKEEETDRKGLCPEACDRDIFSLIFRVSAGR